MNDITLLRDAGPDAPRLTNSALSRARAALLEEIEGVGSTRRFRLPSAKARWRIGLAVTTAAAAWTAAVVVAGPESPGSPATRVTLVDFRTPTFPLSLDPAPPGLRPAFDGTGQRSSVADYRDAAGENGFTIYVGDEEPDGGPDVGADGYRREGTGERSVGGRDAELLRYSRTWCLDDAGLDCPRRSFAQLTWERADDQWVRLLGDGRYASPDRLVGVAESLVDRPQPATLRLGLAPAGWSVQFFKMGRVLTLVNDAYAQQTLTVAIPLSEDVVRPEDFPTSLQSPVGPVIEVIVHDRPAHLMQMDAGYRHQKIWFLQAQFEDGTVYELQVPDAFTQNQVVELAEQVTYHP